MSDRPDTRHVGWPADLPPAWSAVPHTTLLGFLVPRLTRRPEQVAVIFDDGMEVTCATIVDRAQRVAGGLTGLVRPGDRVALAVGNRAEFLIAYLAILAHRGTVVTLSPGIGPGDAAHVLADSGSVLAIAEAKPAEVIASVRTECPALQSLWTIADSEPDGLADHYGSPVDLAAVEADIDDVTDIGYTSGTTGMPKALPGTSRELLRYTDVFLRTTSFGPDDRILCPLQFHYGDPMWLLFASLEAGVPMIAMRRFSVSRFLPVAREHRATLVFSVGAVPNLLLAAPADPSDRDHHLRLAIAVGIPRERHRELHDRFGFPWVEYYGSSESGPAIAMPEACAADYVGTGALGFPLPDVDARLVDTDGREIDGPATGELELSGAVLFEGYLANPDATAEIWDGKWLRTGDLMRRDGDGAFYFEGRRKELIRRGGENLAPAEVEATLRLHPSVVDVAVVPVDDPLRGEEVKAYVEIVDGHAFEPEALHEFATQRLAAFKVPRYFEHRLEPFPRTPSQRIPKNQLKTDGRHTTDRAWDREVHR
jgi:carnitine-CoA ligase